MSSNDSRWCCLAFQNVVQQESHFGRDIRAYRLTPVVDYVHRSNLLQTLERPGDDLANMFCESHGCLEIWVFVRVMLDVLVISN